MKMTNIFAVFLALALAVTSQFALAAAGQITALQGTAQATPQTGATRTLKHGDPINELDTIKTGDNSSLVVRFEDGQVTALGANSSMKVSAYTYNFKEPAKGNVLLTLLTGGMRSITGLIGKARPDRVAYQAGIYTIGILGTDVSFAVSGGNSFVVTVANGRIIVRAQGGNSVEISSLQAALGMDGQLTTGTIDAILAQIQTTNRRLYDALIASSTNFLKNAVQNAVLTYSENNTSTARQNVTCGVSCN